MKTITFKRITFLNSKNKVVNLIIFLIAFTSFAQTSVVDISVNWPNWSSENRVEIYDPSNNLISTIDNGFAGGSNNSYATTVNLGCIADGNNYYAVLYDLYNDGWNGATSNITITSAGTTVLTNSGNSANTSGVTLYFNVSGGCITTYCPSSGNTSYATGITLVNFNTINNADGPGKDNGYEDFTSISTTVSQNTTYNLTVNNNTDGNVTTYTTAWIDWNQDGDFTDAGETYDLGFATNVTDGATSNSPLAITIPATASLGNTRMRISTRYNNYSSSCQTNFDGEVEDYSLEIITSTPQPEINISGNGTTIATGDTTPTTTDDTDFGSVDVVSGNITNTFTIDNIGTLPLNLTGASPYVSISGANASDFTLISIPSTPISAGNNTSFSITFDPSSNGLRSAIITIANNDSNENPYTFYIQGYGTTPLTEGPGGVTSNLETWLKANDGAGISDNQPLTTWYDQANTNNATVNTTGQEPTYRDNANYNVNYNAVVDFDSNYTLSPTDPDYSYDDTNGDFLEGASGFYTQDMFAVVIPDTNINSTFGNMDLFCGDETPGTDEEDVTGIGFGRYSVRFDDEVFAYCVGPSSATTPYQGYGVADNGTGRNYDNVGILNARNNTATTQQELYYNASNVETIQNEISDFSNVNNSRYWLGRSEGYEAATNARVVEVISFSSRKNDVTLTDERNRIQSYLAIKYGITLGDNGTSQDYVASDGSVIWDVSTNSGFNYDIAGIGRDDNSDLTQKQSKSVNNSSIVSFSLDNTELTNNLNTNAFNTTNEFLVWGNDGQNTNSSATSITVNLGPATITTVTDVMNRKWKIVETAGDDIEKVEVSIFETDLAGLPPLTGNDAYVMLVSDDANFTTNLQTVFMDPSTFNGISTREGTYDFDGTKYFTFGVAHEEVRTRHLGFDGIDNVTVVGNKVDLAGDFTASAWVKPDGSNALATDKVIVSKNNGTEGYKFFLTDNNIVSFSIGNAPSDRIDSNVTVPNNIWHHVAVTFDGSTARLYIDGVLDNSKAIANPTPNGAEFAIGAIYIDKSNVQDFFKGDIDEIRVWDQALSVDQLRYVMNQELEKAAIAVNGTVVPNTITKNEIEVVNWTNLLAYYNMNSYIGTHLNDVSGNGNRGSLTDPDQFTLEYQSSPLPYNTSSNGNWDDNSSWVNGSELYIPGSPSLVDPNITVDWNIVKTNHHLTLDNSSLPAVNNENRTLLGFFIESDQVTVLGDNTTHTGSAVTVSHYLRIDGELDLDGESQLIQTIGSDLDILSSGTLERDQQGTQDLYTYNYWSSPVGATNTTSNNNSYTLPTILRDGSISATSGGINFITNSYDGTNGSPIGIADYWIWKYANQSGAYSDWQHVRSTGSISAGEGFTMKGVANTGGNMSLEQNYVTEGKPNNGEITLPITAGNEYLVGNPYASAIDAHQFIMDNAPTIEGAGSTTGTLYFWEHWGGGSHVLAEYQGGYATYNLSGATPAASLGTNDPMVATGGTPSKLPGRYIPVAQGFFVKSEATGNVEFNNGQRVFEKEGTASSVFVRMSNENTTAQNYNSDDRLKIRLGLNSVNGIHRQLLVTQDANATSGYDWGYDGENTETQIDDMYWRINNNNYIIQGTDVIDANTVLPIGLTTDDTGDNTFTIDALENVPADLEIYLHDSLTDTYHDLRVSDFTINLGSGNYLNRFELVFDTPEALSTDDITLENNINVYFSNSLESIVVNNPKLNTIKSVNLYNILGQHVINFSDLETQDYIELNTGELSTGNYIIKLNTEEGEISKKVLVE